MQNYNIESLIKENFKNIAIRMQDLNLEDRQSLLNEFKEWILDDINIEEIMMLPYEAYTDIIDNNYLEENNKSILSNY